METLLTQPTLCKSVFAAEEKPYWSPLVASTTRCSVIPGLPRLLLAALHSQSSPSRQHILWLSQRPWLLEGSLPVVHTVDTCSRTSWRATTGVLRSLSPFSLSVGSYRTPGFVRGMPRSYTPCLASILAFWHGLLIRVGRSS